MDIKWVFQINYSLIIFVIHADPKILHSFSQTEEDLGSPNATNTIRIKAVVHHDIPKKKKQTKSRPRKPTMSNIASVDYENTETIALPSSQTSADGPITD